MKERFINRCPILRVYRFLTGAAVYYPHYTPTPEQKLLKW